MKIRAATLGEDEAYKIVIGCLVPYMRLLKCAAGASLLALAWALEVATGECVTGATINRTCPVLYLDWEWSHEEQNPRRRGAEGQRDRGAKGREQGRYSSPRALDPSTPWPLRRAKVASS